MAKGAVGFVQPPGMEGSGKVLRVSVPHPGLLWEGLEGTTPGEAEHTPRTPGEILPLGYPYREGGSGDMVCDMWLSHTKENGLCPIIPEQFWTSVPVKNGINFVFWQGR